MHRCRPSMVVSGHLRNTKSGRKDVTASGPLVCDNSFTDPRRVVPPGKMYSVGKRPVP